MNSKSNHWRRKPVAAVKCNQNGGSKTEAAPLASNVLKLGGGEGESHLSSSFNEVIRAVSHELLLQ